MTEISVIVPIYNREDYIKRAVDSILNQSFSDFELILVDDGSTDASGLLCDRYSVSDSRVKVIHKEHSGVSAARNAALDIATGRYIAFVDSDDYIHSRAYEFLYESAEKYGADITICRYYTIFNEDTAAKEISQFRGKAFEVPKVYALKKLVYEQDAMFIILCNKFFKRSMFDKVRFKDGAIFEDALLSHRLLYNASVIVMVPYFLYYYYIHKNSITNSPFSVEKLDFLIPLEDRVKFFVEIGQKEFATYVEEQYIKKIFKLYEGTYKYLIDDNRKKGIKKLKKSMARTLRYIIINDKITTQKKLSCIAVILNSKLYKKFNY